MDAGCRSRLVREGGDPSTAMVLRVRDAPSSLRMTTEESQEYLQQRYGVPEELVKCIAGMGALVAKAVE